MDKQSFRFTSLSSVISNKTKKNKSLIISEEALSNDPRFFDIALESQIKSPCSIPIKQTPYTHIPPAERGHQNAFSSHINVNNMKKCIN